MSRVRHIAVPLIALSLVTAACSDDGDDAGTDTTSEVSTETTEAATETTEAAPETTGAAPETTAAAPETTEAAPETTEAAPETTEAAATATVVEVLTEAGTYTTLLAAADAAGLTERLAAGELTLLAPTDEAFAAAGHTVESLSADPAATTALLELHLLPVAQHVSDISAFSNVLTASGAQLPVVAEGDVVTVGGATIVDPDREAMLAVVQGIDAVLAPPAAG